jgi:predicted DNA-binding protein
MAKKKIENKEPVDGTIPVNIRMPVALHERLSAMAADDVRTVSNAVVFIVKRYFDEVDSGK